MYAKILGYLIKAAPVLIFLVLLIASLVYAYHSGSSHGAGLVQASWYADKVKQQAAILKVQQENAEKEKANQAENKRISDELVQAQTAHTAAVAALRSEYDKRLQVSSLRADVYRKQAEGTAVERASLASHAAELDRSLEEGRNLVAELQDRLGLREQQLKSLAQQIQSDRKLLDE